MSIETNKRPTSLDRTVLFARNFVKHPKMLGSLIPSSRFLINRLLRRVNWDRARVLIEYGPGVGVITSEILRRMAPDATLIAIEMNGEFVEYLRQALPDPRLHVVHGSAAEVETALKEQGLTHADAIISGIPYSTMPADVRAAILNSSYAVLSAQGSFLVYQFSRAALPYLQGVFKQVELDFEPLNILPARLFYCRP